MSIEDDEEDRNRIEWRVMMMPCMMFDVRFVFSSKREEATKSHTGNHLPPTVLACVPRENSVRVLILCFIVASRRILRSFSSRLGTKPREITSLYGHLYSRLPTMWEAIVRFLGVECLHNPTSKYKIWILGWQFLIEEEAKIDHGASHASPDNR